MKKCATCKIEKRESEFHPNKTKVDGLQVSCKPCKAEYNKAHYIKNKKSYVERALRQKKEIAEENLKLYREIKSRPCKDCGNVYHPWCMEFDHRGEKSFGIAQVARWKKWSKVLKEIEKCDLVCANCHRLRTFSRRYGNTALV